jgi:hypothetical protein
MPNSSQNPTTFGWKRASNIVPYTYPGIIPVSFPGGVAAPTVPLWNALLNELVPHINGGLNPGSCFGFENRANVNNPSMASFHAYGLALDINASSNPNGTSNRGKAAGHFQLPSETDAIATKYGCEWLGDSDPMHIECHASPDEIPGLIGGFGPAVGGLATSVATGVSSSLSSTTIGLVAIGAVVVIGGIIVVNEGLK